MNSNKTTCPLDCYDGCSIVFENGKLKGDKKHPITKGYLCSKMNKFLSYKRLNGAYYKNEKIQLEDALKILIEKIKYFKDGKNLFFLGSGNLGRIQNITKEFFSKMNFYGTKGSLCDLAGDAGIKEGRGENLLLPMSEIKKSEIIIVWGRDPSISNTHMLPYLKDKKLIIIDPYKTNLSFKADIYLQVKPRGDFYLALLLSRILYITQGENVEFIKNKTENFDDFVNLFESFHMKKLSEMCDIAIDKAWEIIDLIKNKKIVFLVGIGVQKYFIGNQVLRAIDSFAAMLGLFGQEGCGVSYLANSFYGFKSSIAKLSKTVVLPTIDFSKFNIVFIQGANPAVSLPNTKKVIESLKKSSFVVYFGLYENETSKLADLVIPAVDFLSKNDVKTNYGHEYIGLMTKQKDTCNGISEYEFTKYLIQKFFNVKIKSEKDYIKEIIESNTVKKDGYLISKAYTKIPYKNNFLTDNGKFIFLDDFEDDFEDDFKDNEKYFLITKKNKNSLNSSFKIDNFLYIPPLLGFKDDEKVELVSDYGKAEFLVKIDMNLRMDTLMCHAGNRYYNYLTPSMCSLKGNNAVFQELKVMLKKV